MEDIFEIRDSARELAKIDQAALDVLVERERIRDVPPAEIWPAKHRARLVAEAAALLVQIELIDAAGKPPAHQGVVVGRPDPFAADKLREEVKAIQQTAAEDARKANEQAGKALRAIEMERALVLATGADVHAYYARLLAGLVA